MPLLVIVSKPAALNLKKTCFLQHSFFRNKECFLASCESKRFKQKVYRNVQQVAAAASARAAIALSPHP